MSELRYPLWQKPYEEALLESDLQKLRERLMEAENAIFLRLQELSASTAGNRGERLAINDAILGLRSLQTKKLNFPNGGSE